MIETPQLVQTETLTLAKLYAKVPVSEISREMGKLVGELQAGILAQEGVSITGPWLTHHFQRPVEFFDFEVCFPVSKPVQPAGRIQPGEWPAMTVIRTIYQGPYQGLVPAWGEFMTWITESGHQITEDIWERYLIGPDSGVPPAEWRTELNRVLQT